MKKSGKKYVSGWGTQGRPYTTTWCDEFGCEKNLGFQVDIINYCFTRTSSVRAYDEKQLCGQMNNDENGWSNQGTTRTNTAPGIKQKFVGRIGIKQWRIQLRFRKFTWQVLWQRRLLKIRWRWRARLIRKIQRLQRWQNIWKNGRVRQYVWWTKEARDVPQLNERGHITQ